MAEDATQIVIPGRAYIYVAALGTVAPADADQAVPTGWVEVGYTTQDSLQFVENPTFAAVNSHQSDFVTRNFQTADAASVEVDLQEFNAANLLNVFGGGTITQISAPAAGTPGQYRYSPPAVGGRANVACIAEFRDGSKHYRIVVPNCFQNAGVTMKLAKTAEVTLPLRLNVVGTDGLDPWYLLSDDPAMAPPA